MRDTYMYVKVERRGYRTQRFHLGFTLNGAAYLYRVG